MPKLWVVKLLKLYVEKSWFDYQDTRCCSLVIQCKLPNLLPGPNFQFCFMKNSVHMSLLGSLIISHPYVKEYKFLHKKAKGGTVCPLRQEAQSLQCILGWWGCHFVRSHQKRLGSFGGKLSQKLLFWVAHCPPKCEENLEKRRRVVLLPPSQSLFNKVL